MQERRTESRQRALKSGKIVFNNRSSTIDCTVRNLSKGGARLLVAASLGIPDVFILEMDAGAMSRSCQVIWRKAQELGVRFEES